MAPLLFLARRTLSESRARTLLSGLAVALGVAVIVATGVFISGIRAAWAGGENKMGFLIDFGMLAFYAVGALILIAAGFLIFNAFAMSVLQRRRQIGLLRSLGMARRQVSGLVLTEALVTGGLGTLAGIAVGPVLGQAILAVMHSLMGLDVGRGEVAWPTVALALALGLGMTLLATLIPARRAARVTPMEALSAPRAASGSAPGRRRIGRAESGAILLFALLIYLLLAPPGEWTGYHSPWDWIMPFLLWGVWLAGIFLITPALLVAVIKALRWPLRRLGGNLGRLVGDNLARAPDRVALTVLTFAVGLMTLVGAGGEIGFMNEVLVKRVAESILHELAWYLYPFDRSSGVGQLNSFGVDAPGLEPVILAEVYRLADGRATVGEAHMVVVPEISSPMPGFPTFIISDPERLVRPGYFNLVEGDWATIGPRLKTAPCAALVTPAVAGRLGVGVGDTLPVTGLAGVVPCQIVGLGAGGFPAPVSIMGPGSKANFVAEGKTPDGVTVRPQPGADIAKLEADLYALQARYPGQVFVSRPEGELRSVLDTSDQLMMILNGLVMLGIVGAALGMINTTLMSVLERRRELGLLRAVGATRRQIAILVVAEAMLMGFLGALLGTLAGIGMGAIYALAYGGVTFGLVDLSLWWAAGQTVLPALRNGWPGLVAAPLLAALAAYPAARLALRGSTIETLEAE